MITSASGIRHEPYPPLNGFSLNKQSWQFVYLVAWWPPADIRSRGTTTLLDNNGFSFAHGTFVNTPVWSIDQTMGPAILLDNADTDYISITEGLITPSAGAGTFTIAGWFNATHDAGTIISSAAAGSPDRWEQIVDYQGGELRGIHREGLAPFGITTYAIDDGTTYHYALTWDRSDLRLYVNGEEVDSDPSTASHSNPTKWEIGRQAGDANNYFHGLVGDQRVYRTALSAEQIWELYHPNSRYDLYRVLSPAKELPDSPIRASTVMAYIETLDSDIKASTVMAYIETLESTIKVSTAMAYIEVLVPMEDVYVTKTGIYAEITGDDTIYASKVGAYVEHHTPWSSVPDDPTNLVAVVV